MTVGRNHFWCEKVIPDNKQDSSVNIYESLYVNKKIKGGDKIYGKVF